jgi:RNA polymerase sigma-70 factor (ECF subfamily)
MGGGRVLTYHFLEGLTPTLRDRLSSLSHLEGVLRDILEEARAAWPEIELDPEDFLPYLAERLPADAEAERALLEIRAADLYLACACVRGLERAMQAFETQCYPEIHAALLRRDPSGQLEDIKQTLYQKLFLGDEEHRPKIGQYAGRGDLRSWVCVTAVREAIDLLRKLKHEQPLDDSALVELTSPDEDQELHYLKRLYREEFKVAFQQALGALSARERTVLRYNLLDGLNIDQIGAIYNVHRATVARWIAAAREGLLAKTREVLMERLRVDQTEFESIMRLIQSHFDVSIHHFLGKDPRDP